MPLVHYGSSGDPWIYVPTSGGDEQEFARYGMPEICRPWIEAGKMHLVSIDGCGPRTLFSDTLPPRERIAGYAAFERYASEELLPWMRERTGRERIGLIGASYGGYVVANLLFKYPEQVRIAFGMGGVYGLWHRLHGHHDDDVYFHTPLEYLPRLEDPAILERIRGTGGIVLYGARDDGWLESTERMAEVVAEKGIPHRVDIWGSPADHHERWWRQQLHKFLVESYGNP
ncbi:hypothetical protein ABI59_00675 [Acidobacteria bacterium Mor1]|nr:hypothetical protein ABI59_00675 [Acidobacteria bacterium Mor1]